MMQHVNLQQPLSEEDIADFVNEALAHESIDRKRLLFIIPDSTRSMPMPAMFRALVAATERRAEAVDFLIALGTHPPMPEDAINRLIGVNQEERNTRYAAVNIFNHEWQNLDRLQHIGTIEADEIAELSNGLMRQKAAVLVNKRIFDYDRVILVGPVFPHEVVGFSGGNKYFFPGVAGAEILNLFHWLGALITNPVINGTKHTPVRAVIDKAASMIHLEKRCFCLNVSGSRTHGIFYGEPEEAWSVAADLSAQTHIVYKEKPYRSVLAMAPEMYDDIWVAGKCMYKLEPVVADGGELIIYAPHISEISYTHGKLIRRIGYHTRDYFLAQMDKFRDVPGGILAHSTHVRGIGTFENGVEKPRIQVTLATQIPRDVCESINLGYRDPSTINPEDWRDKEHEGMLLVEHAGEVLYRLKS